MPFKWYLIISFRTRKKIMQIIQNLCVVSQNSCKFIPKNLQVFQPKSLDIYYQQRILVKISQKW